MRSSEKILSNFLLCLINTVINGQILVQPEQVHIAYGGTPYEMLISWVTHDETKSIVEFGAESLNHTAKGVGPYLFQDGGSRHRTMWMHRVFLTKLTPGTTYKYHVGSEQGWSPVYSFTAMKSGFNWAPRFAVFGDMGNENATIMASLQELAQTKNVDAVLHIGDFAYDLHSENATVGDAFMNQIESVAAYVPYMVCVGNHEHAYNFSNYKARFSMPSDNEGLFYSFDVGPAHIIAVSTEVYYFTNEEKYGGVLPAIRQLQWLKKDLLEANKPENRKLRPWVIVVGHRPLYCSNNDSTHEHCNNLNNNKVRTGFPHKPNIPGLEKIFYEQGVDLAFFAHEHSYERLWPVYDLKVCNGSISPYTDPRSTVYVVTGSGGNNEGQTRFDKIQYPWSATHTDDFGYTLMTVLNATHLHLQQISVLSDLSSTLFDEMTLVKSKHGAGIYDCHKTR